MCVCVCERERERAHATHIHTYLRCFMQWVLLSALVKTGGWNLSLSLFPPPSLNTHKHKATPTQANMHAHTHTHTHTINLYSLWNLIQALGMFVMPAAGPSGWFLVCAWFWGDPDGQTDKKHCTTLIILLCFYFLLTKCLLMVEYTLCLANCLFSLLETGRYCCETPFCVCIPFVTSDINHVNLLAHQINFYNCYDIMRKK